MERSRVLRVLYYNFGQRQHTSQNHIKKDHMNQKELMAHDLQQKARKIFEGKLQPCAREYLKLRYRCN